ncbi:ABC transporter ATP-binding protein/permease [Macrococcus equipercicus]|uniref:ATP-binding cassette domain-containing protein n=1 Tax=Macrococcus equipercicus TaxID=69967 RepID=A0A9Q9BXA5_9STAP|nr:ABC transporter transmembrane domain-containing protein [Macrococcus equipercicus]UTH14287.1 ATP-binding cassette domain-containing protein [Macrococcus equipercicus]
MKYLTKLSGCYFYFHILMVVSAVLLAGIIIMQSVQIGKIIDSVLLNHHINFGFVIATVLLILIVRSVLQTLLKSIGAMLSRKVKSLLRRQLLSDRRDTAETLNLSTEGIEGIDSFYSDYLPQVYRSTFIPLLIIVFLLFFHRNAAFIMLITAPFIPIFYIIIGINTSKKAAEQMTVLNQFSAYFLDAVRGIVTIKLFSHEDKVKQAIGDKSQQFKDKTMVILKTAFLSTLMLEFIAMLSIGIIALEIGIGLIVLNKISFYTAVVTLMLAPEFYNALKDLGMAFHTGKQSEGYAELLDYKPAEKIVRQYERVPTINADFSVDYGHFKLIVDDAFSLRETVICGPSGAGKSTFAKVIAGVIESGHGAVEIPEAFHHDIAYMAQQPFVMSDTIMNNITMFNDHSLEEIVAVAKSVNMHDRIMAFKEGYDTLIGAGGEQLSGGETHRLMLMRMLLNPAKLIIFDEPTAMLDHDTEQLIKAAIAQLKETAVVWTVAHQVETIRQAPYLMIFNKGIVVQGTHSAMKQEPFYKAVMK